MRKRRIYQLLLALILLSLLVGPALAQGLPKASFDWIVTRRLTVSSGRTLFLGRVDVNGNQIDLDADADTSITADTDDQLDFEIGGADEVSLTAATLDLNNTYVDQELGVENLGGLPSVITATVSYSPGSGTVATIADGEIWIVHQVLFQVGANFDCSVNDCTLDIGDGNDVDGLLDLADANLQTTFTDYTGAQAGWAGLDGSAPRGAYLIGGPQVYAPSGGAETIDYAAGGTSPSAGSGTVYIIYTRVQ